MRKMMMVGAAIMLSTVGFTTAAHAGAGSGGGPVTDPGDDPGNPGEGDPGDGGTPSAPTPTPTPTPAPTPSMLVGSGHSVFNLDTLPVGSQGTERSFQPFQDYTSIGLGTIASAQGDLNQTSNGLTVSLRTADYVYGTSTAQTSIWTENMGSLFGYVGAPLANQQTIQAVTGTSSPPGAIYANFSDTIDYFSAEAIRLVGTFTYNVTFNAYSGLNGTGSLLGSVTGTVGDANVTNFESKLFELNNIAGARSIAMISDSNNTRYDNLTATAAPVPEPGEWAMMAAGLGLVGGLVRRRKARAA